MNKLKSNGEVFTPVYLINDMIDKLPADVWGNPDLKWLDPCAGIGNFQVVIIERLMIGLKDIIEDADDRKRHILKNMIYMVEIDAGNCNEIKKAFEGYDINLYECSYINTGNLYKVKNNALLFDFKFDIIVANPPYQYNKIEGVKSNRIWDKFVKYSYSLIKEAGYLLFVHPCGWRDLAGLTRFIFNYNKDNNLIYLNMNNYKAGLKTFGVWTNYDYYLVQNVKCNDNITRINDIYNEEYGINLNEWGFIPSAMFNEVKKLIDGVEKVDLIFSSSKYDTRRKDFPFVGYETEFPCVWTMSKSKGIVCKYAISDVGHFGVPKLIFSNGKGDPYVDYDGKYGLTPFSFAIGDVPANLQMIKDAVMSEAFLKIMSCCIFKKLNTYNYKVFKVFKKDFYKAFIQ